MEQNSTGTNVTVSDSFLHKDAAVTAMIFGIVSVLTAFLPVLSLLGVVFGILAIVKSRKNKRFALEKGIPENGMNTAGFVTGIVGLIIAVILTLIYALALFAALFFISSVSSEAITSAADAISGATTAIGGGLSLPSIPLN